VEEGPFRYVKFTGEGAWITLPGWQVLLTAEDPVALLCESDRLPFPPDQASEEVVIVIDRAQRNWDRENYFVVDTEGQLEVEWFADAPHQPLLGRLVLVIRPKRILDEEATKELWHLDE
jgi:hypothetical protein